MKLKLNIRSWQSKCNKFCGKNLLKFRGYLLRCYKLLRKWNVNNKRRIDEILSKEL